MHQGAHQVIEAQEASGPGDVLVLVLVAQALLLLFLPNLGPLKLPPPPLPLLGRDEKWSRFQVSLKRLLGSLLSQFSSVLPASQLPPLLPSLLCPAAAGAAAAERVPLQKDPAMPL